MRTDEVNVTILRNKSGMFYNFLIKIVSDALGDTEKILPRLYSLRKISISFKAIFFNDMRIKIPRVQSMAVK